MMTFYCNGKHALCELDTCPEDCEYFDDSGGEYVDPEPVVVTNGDKIRAMTDEELAKHIVANAIHCPPGVRPSPTFCVNGCFECCKNWLKRPVEVEK